VLICERIFSSNKLFKLPSYIHGVACFYTYSNILFFFCGYVQLNDSRIVKRTKPFVPQLYFFLWCPPMREYVPWKRKAQRLVLSNVQSLSFSVSSSSQLTVDDDRPVALPNSIFTNLPTCTLTARLREIFIQAIVEVIADPCMDFLRTSMHGQNPGRISSVQSPLFGLIACCQSMNHDYTLLRCLRVLTGD